MIAYTVNWEIENKYGEWRYCSIIGDIGGEKLKELFHTVTRYEYNPQTNMTNFVYRCENKELFGKGLTNNSM